MCRNTCIRLLYARSVGGSSPCVRRRCERDVHRGRVPQPNARAASSASSSSSPACCTATVRQVCRPCSASRRHHGQVSPLRLVVSGAGVTSYDRRWCWCRHAHTSSRHAPAPSLHICLLRRHLQIMTHTVCADRRQRGQPTALLVPSVGRVGDCCCCGLLPRAQMTHVHTSSKQHSLGRVIVSMSTAPVLCRWAVQPRGALAIAISSAQRSMRRSPQSDATKPARA